MQSYGGANTGLRAEEDEKSGLEHLRFVGRSVRRHWRFVVLFFAAGIGASVLLLNVLPKTYRVKTQLLARRQQMLPSIARPSLGDESPTAGAFEAVHRRDNLIGIIRKAGLLQSGTADSSAKPGEDERLEILIKRLDTSLLVVPEEGILTISITWPDGEAAYRIVESAVADYLERRRNTEIAPIEETVSLLEARASSMLPGIIALQTEAKNHRPAKSRRAGATTRPDVPSQDPVAAELEARLRAKQQAVADIEEYRRRKVAELRAQLAQEQTLYGQDYPSLVTLKQSIEALSQPSSQLASLRDEQRALEEEYRRRYGHLPRSIADGVLPGEPLFDLQRDDAADAIQSRLKRATLEYQAMLERIGSARIELEIARSAFKYRYSVLWPAQVPKTPYGPSAAKVLGGGAVFSLLLAIAIITAFDLLCGRIVESRQVEQKLGLRVLGQIQSLK
jgi:uncharacterized protein involved in exopolysaccharide biosynthesis